MNIAIIGAGYTGLACAHDLVRAGHQVSIFEADSQAGGLAGTFELYPGRQIEKFYHHWFTSDRDILGLIEELGLTANTEAHASNTGLYFANSIFRLASPLDLLKFHPIPLFDRIRTGLMALKARKISDWKSLEDQSAADWIVKYGGKRGYEAIWKPLLAGKFGPEAENISAVWFWNKLKLRGSSRDNKGAENLVYYNGSFGAFSSELCAQLVNRGVKFFFNHPVEEIVCQNGVCQGLRAQGKMHQFDAVLATVPLPTFLKITPEYSAEERAKAEKIRFLGNVCIVLRLKRSLSSTYWLNVADPSFPFVGIIEHTNFDDRQKYNGEHIAYLSKYLPTSEAMFQMSDQQVLDYCLPFIQRMFPEFNADWLIGFKIWRAHYSQPVITKHYSQSIPDFQTSQKNLWLCTMAQVYPEDRGTNYAIAYGRKVARLMLASLETNND